MATEVRTKNVHGSEAALRLAAEQSYAYLRGVQDRNVAPDAAAVHELAGLHERFAESASEPSDVVAQLNRLGAPATVATTGGRYFGFVIGGTLAASWLANAWDQNAALRVMSPVAAELEDVVLKWVCEVLGLPRDCEGGLVTCATTANFTALATARHALLARMGWNVAEDGMFGAPPIQVVVGEEVHASVLKALNLAGFGNKRVTVVEADNQGRMRADRLPKMDTNTIVCIQAGNVNSGAFDPAREICQRAHEQGAWVHVDGAFGLWAAASPKYKHLVEGFELADSWATDAHKWPNINYESGIGLVREGGDAGGDDHQRSVLATGNQTRTDAPRAGGFAAIARDRVVGGAEVAGTGGAGRFD